MKQAIIALLILTTPALADETKPVANQAAEAMTPYAAVFGKSVSRSAAEFMAGAK